MKVCLDGWSAVLEAYAKQFNITKLKRIVTGGATGQESIYNGLKAIKEDNEETKDSLKMKMVMNFRKQSSVVNSVLSGKREMSRIIR